jgi:hypothetical protein
MVFYINSYNAPLILKMRDIIFFCGQTTYWAISRDISRGPRPSNLGVKKVEAPSKYLEMAHYVVCPKQKK